MNIGKQYLCVPCSLGLRILVGSRLQFLHAPVNRSLSTNSQLAARSHVNVPVDFEVTLAVQPTVYSKSSREHEVVPTPKSVSYHPYCSST
jgi:hypothetical protein